MKMLHPRRALGACLSALILAGSPPTSARAASPEEGEVAGRERPGPAAAARSTDGAQAAEKRKRKGKASASDPRDELLARIRLDCDDPATCWLQDGDSPPAGPVAPLTEEELEGLVREILAGLEAHQDANTRRAEEELADRRRLEEQWFGSSDHHLNPSTGYYEDPLKTLADRPALHLDKVRPSDFDIPIVINERVQDWMVYFLTRGRKHYVRWLARSERYIPLLRAALAEAGLPQDLCYQSMIESGFNPYATSTAAAVGVWQFMPRTGTFYGLQNDWWIDERRDPVRATEAAIRYLKYLHKLFGSWELASAAYNAGEGKIGKAIKMYGTTDFWDLSSDHRSYLKPETKHYVPKIMAAAILHKYVQRYGLLEEILAEDRLGAWDFDVVQVPEATDLALVAEVAGLEVEALHAINPQLKRGFTPPGVVNYPVNIPKGKGEGFAEAFAKVQKEERLTFVRHTVARGQTLSEIADRYGVPVSSLAKLNQIKDPTALRVGTTLTVPVRADSLLARQIVHVVAKGETLGGIAGRYGVSVSDLKAQNGLRGDTIGIGQRLTVQSAAVAVADPGKGSGKAASSESSAKSSKGGEGATSYTVRSGDTLSEIAERFGTTSSALRAMNGLSSNTIQVGQKLALKAGAAPEGEAAAIASAKPAPSVATTSYTVQSGDVLGTIAERHGMSVDALRSLNGISGSTIKVGQRLKVAASGGSGTERATASAPAGKVNHTVQSGEVLGTIASRYGVSVTDVQRWNGLSGTTIKVGQTLAIHGAAAKPQPKGDAGTTHEVASGESLWSIAQKHGVTVSELRAWNGLRGNDLRPGQKLTVKR